MTGPMVTSTWDRNLNLQLLKKKKIQKTNNTVRILAYKFTPILQHVQHYCQVDAGFSEPRPGCAAKKPHCIKNLSNSCKTGLKSVQEIKPKARRRTLLIRAIWDLPCDLYSAPALCFEITKLNRNTLKLKVSPALVSHQPVRLISHGRTFP